VHTAPGTTVPLRVVRDRKPQSLNVTIEELNVDDEINPSRGGTTQPEPDATPEPKETGFGMTIEPLTAQMSRRLQVPSGRTGVVVSDLDPRGAAAQGGVRPGDVILSINSQNISTSDDAIKVLDQIQSGHTARVIVWRQGLGAEQLFTLRKK
jgi:serine protease Do